MQENESATSAQLSKIKQAVISAEICTASEWETLARSRGQLQIDEAMLRAGYGREEDILRILASVLDLPFLDDLSALDVDEQKLDQVSPSFAEKHNIVPLLDGRWAIATVFTDEIAQIVGFLTEAPVLCAIATRATIQSTLEQFSDTTAVDTEHAPPELLAQIDGPAVRYVQDCIVKATEDGASDIHFDTAGGQLHTRQRIGGRLVPGISGGVDAASVIARLKVLAGLNVAERRLPQDGRISFRYAGQTLDLRLSTLPTGDGESAVLRILNQQRVALDWKTLGFKGDDIARLRRILSQPSGLFLLTGPTGSGKTTTLYTALSGLNTPERKIITVEDPIEYRLPGISQVAVRTEVGLDFASALRAILRQDPNVIMIGEIRDAETASIACRAALVGRLVLSSLHTNSAADAETRLRDLGVEPYLIKAVLRGVVGQRLETRQDSRGAWQQRLDYEIETYV